jgi:hypothetical protein
LNHGRAGARGNPERHFRDNLFQRTKKPDRLSPIGLFDRQPLTPGLGVVIATGHD